MDCYIVFFSNRATLCKGHLSDKYQINKIQSTCIQNSVNGKRHDEWTYLLRRRPKIEAPDLSSLSTRGEGR